MRLKVIGHKLDDLLRRRASVSQVSRRGRYSASVSPRATTVGRVRGERRARAHRLSSFLAFDPDTALSWHPSGLRPHPRHLSANGLVHPQLPVARGESRLPTRRPSRHPMGSSTAHLGWPLRARSSRAACLSSPATSDACSSQQSKAEDSERRRSGGCKACRII